MELIIELPGRGSQATDLRKFAGETITIGRGFDNDLILSDPHICAHHAVLEIDESGKIQLRDLNSVNGTFIKKAARVEGSCTIDSGDVFYVGKSRIRIYRPDHEVLPSIRLTWVEKLAQLANRPVLTGAACLLAVILSLYLKYTVEIGQYNIGRELLAAMGLLILLGLWPTAWTLFARYKKHDSRFFANLSSIVVFMILLTFIDKFESWLAYHQGESIFVSGVMLVVSLAMVLLLFWFNFYLSIFINNKKRWIYSGAVTAVIAGALYLGTTLDDDRFTTKPEYTQNLFPPSISFYSTQSTDEFLQEAGKVFETALEQTSFKAE